jgi:hypothetical protein
MFRLAKSRGGIAPLSKITLITASIILSTIFLTLLLPITIKPSSSCSGRDIGEVVASTMEGGLRFSSSCILSRCRLVEFSSFGSYEVKIVIDGREEIVEKQPKTLIRIYGPYELFNQELADRNYTDASPICVSYCINSSVHVRPLVQYSRGDVEEYGRRLIVLRITIPVLSIQGLSSRVGDVTINFLPLNSTVKEYMRFFSFPTSALLIINGFKVLTLSFSPRDYQGLIIRIAVQRVVVNLVGE